MKENGERKREKGDLALSFINWFTHRKRLYAMKVPGRKRGKRGEKEDGQQKNEGEEKKGRENVGNYPFEDI